MISRPTAITYSGKCVDLLDPRFHQIDLKDIAHHLALTNRFNGATQLPYTVAQHSCFVATLLEAHKSPRLCLYGLLHDAHEAYVGDLIRPAQAAAFGDAATWRDLCSGLDAAILVRFKLPQPTGFERKLVADADEVALATEWRDLMQGGVWNGIAAPDPAPIKPMLWHNAEDKFLGTFARLSQLCGIEF